MIYFEYSFVNYRVKKKNIWIYFAKILRSKFSGYPLKICDALHEKGPQVGKGEYWDSQVYWRWLFNERLKKKKVDQKVQK